MIKELIDKYIALSMAINVFKQDRESLVGSKVAVVYFAKINAIIEQMKNDFYSIKWKLLNKYHLEVRSIGN
ncbi:hypothetical protein [Virgibacillus ndiopensis]|uniref:hypothetical protein n=1 Tax=Virgibacillus ndiopensis TaxID=2004408 RepID=UPI000C07F0E9|nr:hypothetical protein [Virgibacillus ndiopensis]